MKKLFLIVLCASLSIGCKKEAEPAATKGETMGDATAPVEFADAKYTEIGKKAMKAMEKGDMDEWISNYADNAKYYWGSGDSLVGKPAIDKFWRDRRNNVIETLSYEDDVWLPIKVNELENVSHKGVWLLAWYKVTAKYKGGTTMSQWVHIDFHFDENGKIDIAEQYIDREPIKAAMPKMK